MSELKISPFRKTRHLRSQIDELLDVVADAALAYKRGLSEAVSRGWSTEAEEKYERVSALETRGDKLRDSIGQSLYSEMLLPETAGDVLALLTSLDSLLDHMEQSFVMMRIERCEVPAQFRDKWQDCVALAADSVEQVVVGARSYFRDPQTARDHIHKIHFYEKETQRTALQLLEDVFRSELPLDQMMQIRGHVWFLHSLADLADDAGDSLAIYAVKRSV